MKLGATPKQVAILGVLLLLAAVGYFSGDDGPPPSNGRKATPSATAMTGGPGPRAAITPAAKSVPARPNNSRRASQEFKPVLRPRRVEDRVDPATIDPTLRVDLLARLNSVPIQGGSRALFEFGAAPPPKAPDPGKIKPMPISTVAVAPPKPPGPSVPVTPAKPQAPPIPLKFYGFTSARAGLKRAFFLENNEDVFVASEGDTVKRRYKVVRINMNSVVMEDSEFKQQQTLPLTEQTQ